MAHMMEILKVKHTTEEYMGPVYRDDHIKLMKDYLGLQLPTNQATA